MTNREEKIQELFESLQQLRKNMTHHVIPGENMGITAAQLRTLFIIEEQKVCTVKEIAKILKISSSATTQLVDGLVRIGFVIRKENPDDRRVAILTLTSKATKQHQRMKKLFFKQFIELFKNLNDKELEQYVLLNKKLI